MTPEIVQFTNRGMNQDVSISKASNEFAFKNYNIRITAVNDNTLLSISNEKLPLKLPINIHKKGIIENIIHFDIENKIIYSDFPVKSDFTVSYTFKTKTSSVTENDEILFKKNSFNKFTLNSNVTEVTEASIVQGRVIDSSYIYYTELTTERPELNTIYKERNDTYIKGTCIGNAILNNYLVLFTRLNDYDRIYRLEYDEASNSFTGELLFEGNLGFYKNDITHIETLTYYESEEVQKVYWVDGVNPSRFINIVSDDIRLDDNKQFDFIPTINRFPKCTIQKDNTGNGIFSPGVIQYFITYYNKYGAETGIVWSSDLQYITDSENHAEAPDKTINCSFILNITNLDKRFDYIRVYSAQRSSYNGEPVVKIVTDTQVSTELSVVDTNLNTEIIDSSSLLFLGGSSFIANTIAQKDSTLFLGGIIENANVIPNEIKEALLVSPNNEGQYISPWIEFSTKNLEDSNNSFSEKHIKTFKCGEFYRFGIQFQNINGIWTSPIWIGDKKCDKFPTIVGDKTKVANVVVNFGATLENLFSKYYFKYRLVIAEPSVADRSILAQGVVSPTMFNLMDRTDGSGAYAISSWIMRSRNNNALSDHMLSVGNKATLNDSGTAFNFKNLSTCEIQNANIFSPLYNASELIDNFKKLRINNYYIDNSILTFHSPDLNGNESLFENSNLTFNIIGIVPIETIKSDIELSLDTPGFSKNAGVIKNYNNNSTLINGKLFRDYQFFPDDSVGSALIKRNSYAKYALYLWNKSESIIGQTPDWKSITQDLSNTKLAYLKNKIIANKNISSHTEYFNNIWDSVNITSHVFDSDNVITKAIKSEESTILYQGNYEAILATLNEYISKNTPDEDPSNPSYRVFFDGYFSELSNITVKDHYNKYPQYSPVSIKYKSSPHVVFSLGRNLLPYLSDNAEVSWQDNFVRFYETTINKVNDDAFIWFNKNATFKNAYIQKAIPDIVCDYPYLYIGELSKNINYESLYGGTNANALESISWIPASDSYLVSDSIALTYGDTYYQRWDCLKTYPFTREDQNSVVDITSFMVETHVNLLGRYDKHQKLDDIINVDITNFNKFNNVYNQPNNLFTYNILDDKFDNTNYLNQVSFSLNKIPSSDIDIWTSINLASSFNLDGSKGKLNKLVNFNDTIVAFQDKAISSINFNNRTALSTESGIPIEIANSGKVNGYSIIIDNIGCQNKQSICQTSSGIYFIDDLNKSLFNFNKEGLTNVSSKGLSVWFKDNLSGQEKLFYDYLTQDLYITHNNNCITYNEGLQSFVSFMSYENTKLLVNLNKGSFIISDGDPSIKKMFEGEYTNNYYMQYKVNPEPLLDKTFTNIEYIADVLNEDKIDSINSAKTLNYPFSKLTVWNEYQQGTTDIFSKHIYPKSQRKFRIWRIDIPRGENKRDRIRNPWIMLELSNKNNHHDSKMVFHNLLVKYYK